MRGARTAARAPLLAAVATWCALTLAATSDTPDSLSVLGAILPPFVSEHFDELVKAAAATCEVLPLQLVFSHAALLSAEAARARTPLVRFTRAGRRSYSLSSQWRPRRSEPLVLYVPGWWNTPHDASSSAIVRALLDKHSSVFLLDTCHFFCRGYISAVSSITPLSKILFDFIKKLHDTGYPVSSIHIIGFSLGAHIAGVTGKLVKKELNATLGKITALDPARPCFRRTEYRLDKRDAAFVQVIHSSTGVLGLEEPMGHADVYVNGVAGKHPECQHRSISVECDHAQAWRLYAASALDRSALRGRRCDTWEQLVQDACTGDETELGYSCSDAAAGLYLYKSKQSPEPVMRVFNLFDVLTWPLHYVQTSGE